MAQACIWMRRALVPLWPCMEPGNCMAPFALTPNPLLESTRYGRQLSSNIRRREAWAVAEQVQPLSSLVLRARWAVCSLAFASRLFHLCVFLAPAAGPVLRCAARRTSECPSPNHALQRAAPQRHGSCWPHPGHTRPQEPRPCCAVAELGSVRRLRERQHQGTAQTAITRWSAARRRLTKLDPSGSRSAAVRPILSSAARSQDARL